MNSGVLFRFLFAVCLLEGVVSACGGNDAVNCQPYGPDSCCPGYVCLEFGDGEIIPYSNKCVPTDTIESTSTTAATQTCGTNNDPCQDVDSCCTGYVCELSPYPNTWPNQCVPANTNEPTDKPTTTTRSSRLIPMPFQ